MSSPVDWGLAERLAGYVAGTAPPGLRLRADLPALAAEAETRVAAYTGLRPDRPLPVPEAVSRADWARANLVSMGRLLDPVAAKIGDGAGPLGGTLRTVGGYVIGAEAGVVLGYLGRRVLGQYELVLLDAHAPARLLFVEPNLVEAARTMEVEEEEFTRWVTLHEITHALQFAGVPWLRGHLGGLLEELMGGLEMSFDTGRLLRLPSADDLRGLVDAVRDGDLLTGVIPERQRRTLERVQAVMSVLEGHAEHVMDAVGVQVLPNLGALRAAMQRRRANQSPATRLLSRLLGLELKMRQYEQGKAFCDGVVARGGIAALNRVWSGPEAVPTLAELDDPGAWAERTGVPSVTR